ncbi:putative tyrosyl-tRNA mitochondrial precursor (tyrosine--tRNA ligase) protein [Neofusicoccum parvum]|nr:putative tyrosyl-tRNA mitochondrial precursor (tyrosine--tRNA ligase) protein [Neofusicoccum parvum]
MAPSALVRHAVRPRAYVCRQCQLRQAAPRTPVRFISQGTIRKTIEAEWQWKEQAKEIEAGRKQAFLSMLEERGYIKQIAGDRKVLDKVMTNKRIGAYCGVDPTAPSLHVGHLLPFMVIFWMYLHGFSAYTLLGGATAKIGDPIGRATAREEVATSTRKTNMVLMHMQLKKLWMSVERMGRKHGYVREWAWKRALVNNNTWLQGLDVIEFMKTIGTGFRLGPMLSRDTVKLRQANGEGMSFAEFSYPILQAWDWWHLFNRNRVQLQVGGSDQYGNIVAGIDAINYIRNTIPDPEVQERVLDLKKPQNDYLKAPYGLTVPLLTTSSGEKFGKSAGNAVWLSPELTPSFDLYGFWVRTSDADVERYLKLFTFLPLSTIATVIEEHKIDPSKRLAQHLLAREFIELAHGPIAAEKTAQEHKQIFGRPLQRQETPANPEGTATDENQEPLHASDKRNFINMSSGNKSAPIVSWESAPSVNVFLPKSLVYNATFPKVLHSAGLTASRSEAHRLVTNQGAYVGSRPGQIGGMGDEVKFTPIKHTAVGMPEKYIFDENQLMIRIGKWKVKVITIIPDEEFAAKGLSVPGWDGELGRPTEESK